ncbi:uncharacterized protein A4U43_C10F19290 [Asparagus officinalis]|uniref:Uncharacterized protein n=1 Tax=Asparagus officinalis TaxID=4686 RepID=A0A5P1E480_ASPOF|nr:uncharacterized protein A4U43_C10F19290 [Asparagus officinalis]
MLKEGIAARVRVLNISEKKARIWSLQKQRRQAKGVRVLNISEKKARIWSLQKQRRQAKARLNAGEITQEEFNLEDATFASEVQAEKEAVEVLKQEASAAAAISDAELHKRVREEVLAKHEKSISNTEAHLMSFSLL